MLPVFERQNNLYWYPTLYDGRECSKNVIYTGAVPNQRAVTPDSNIPISFDEPMKIWFTADTLPSMFSGVKVWSSVERTTMLTLSTAPLKARIATDRMKLRESAKAIIATPKSATQLNSAAPARFSGGLRGAFFKG